MKIIIGNKNYSSWSLRPWLALKYACDLQNLPFQEQMIPLGEPTSKAQMLEFSEAGKVPVLIDDGHVIWESLAILEYLNERFPSAKLWPKDRHARALARCIATEMHSGFMNLRKECPMNLRRVNAPPIAPISEAAQADMNRIQTIWAQCRAQFGEYGPFLFGEFSIADAMFAPVATRFHSYGLTANATTKAYIETIYAMPAFQAWHIAALHETLMYESTDII